MTEAVVETIGLTKRFGDVVAVDDVSLQVPRGSIYGLLGPNGAGKTTFIGTLLGLIHPTSGTIRLFGTEIDGATDAALRRIGAIMETPAFYPFLTGRDNLRYFQGISGADDSTEIDRLLDLVGMTDRADHRFITYSLGMKHRMGIAYSLMCEPELLLLDEPTNGLDPAGMAEVRQLIKRLGGDHTVLLASHLLNEVEQVCDHVGILSEGRLIAQGPVSELIGRRNLLLVRTTDDARATEILSRCDWVRSVTDHDGALMVAADPHRAEVVSETLADHRVFLREMTTLDTSLEEYFLRVTEQEEVLV
jgi:ABC-type multidrug transport system ATPase subunit